jgi:hypothetical protein
LEEKIMPFNIQKDFTSPTEKVIQKILSYKQLIPSTDFKDDEYSLYLEYASAEELERDIVKEETYQLIMRN